MDQLKEELIKKIQEIQSMDCNRIMTESELSVLLLAAMLEEEGHE